jgi:hypothetical protein
MTISKPVFSTFHPLIHLATLVSTLQMMSSLCLHIVLEYGDLVPSHKEIKWKKVFFDFWTLLENGYRFYVADTSRTKVATPRIVFMRAVAKKSMSKLKSNIITSSSK